MFIQWWCHQWQGGAGWGWVGLGGVTAAMLMISAFLNSSSLSCVIVSLAVPGSFCMFYWPHQRVYKNSSSHRSVHGCEGGESSDAAAVLDELIFCSYAEHVLELHEFFWLFHFDFPASFPDAPSHDLHSEKGFTQLCPAVVCSWHVLGGRRRFWALTFSCWNSLNWATAVILPMFPFCRYLCVSHHFPDTTSSFPVWCKVCQFLS